jgi:2-hydroxy-3-keto-5-methylthiopentenyl-1-phosphate phosphatase
MKTVLVLALIVAVCMCSGDVSRVVRLGEGEDDEEIYRDFMKRWCGRDGGRHEMKKIMKRAEQGEKSKIDVFNKRPLDNRLTIGGRGFFKSSVCKLLKVRRSVSDPTLKKIVREIRLDPAFQPFLDRAREDPVQGKWVEGVFQFMIDVVNELEKDSMPVPDVSENPESSSRQSEDNQKGVVGGVQNKGATAERSKSREVDSKAAREDEQRCTVS